MRIVLGPSFFARPAPFVARELLGKYLVRRIDGKTVAEMITETEAYHGEDDLACHASKGRTARTETLYSRPGTIYVYLIYGMYHMLNVVTDAHGFPAAVLIRSMEGAEGPGRLTKHLHIDRSFNTLIASKANGLWFEDRGTTIPARKIRKTPRIGVEYAGEVWAEKPYRFAIEEATSVRPKRRSDVDASRGAQET